MRIVIERDGTPNNDTFYATTNDDFVYHALGGHDLVFTLGGNDELYGDAGLDLLVSGAGNDILHGGASADNLKAEEGDDRLFGDGGNDMLYGDMGQDILTGGRGRDVFVFITNNLTGRGSDVDIVTDFVTDGRKPDFLGLAVAGSDGERISSLKELRPYMSQEGKDVHIEFAAGDLLILEDVRLNWLSKMNFLFEPSLV